MGTWPSFSELGWGISEQGSVSGNWDDDCLRAAGSKDQKQVERSLLHSDRVESIYLRWKPRMRTNANLAEWF